MASYFDEHSCDDTENMNVRRSDPFLRLVRLLLSNESDIIFDDEIDTLFPPGERVAPPASQKAVDDLTRRTVTDEESKSSTKCPVCLIPYETSGTILELPCRHTFHSECILPWLRKTNSCPTCRHELPTDDPEYESYKKEKQEEEDREKRLQEHHNSMFG